MNENKNLGANLSYLRKKNNVSQEDLAEKLNVSRQAISNWERNKTQPDIGMLTKLSQLFNITVENILDEQLLSNNNSMPSKRSTSLPLILYIMNILTTIGYGFFIVTNKSENAIVGLVVSVVILLMATTIFFIFENMLNNNFSMFNSSEEFSNYSIEDLKHLLSNIELYFLISSFAFNLLLLVIALNNDSNLPKLLVLFAHILNFIMYVLFVNWKHKDTLYLHNTPLVERNNSFKNLCVSVSFCITLLINIVTYVGCTIYYSPQDSAILQPLGLLLISIITSFVDTIYESNSVQKCNKSQTKYKISKFFYIAIGINIVVCLTIWLVFYVSKTL